MSNPTGKNRRWICAMGCDRDKPCEDIGCGWQELPPRGKRVPVPRRPPQATPLEIRFWRRVRAASTDECWEYLGKPDRHGYGRVWDGHSRRAHRVAYELANGPIPLGLAIDHLCRNRRCVNPSHLEVVTHTENTLRGESFSGQNARKTHCVNGHPLDEGNTYRQGGRRRQCRRCNADAVSRHKARIQTMEVGPA